MKKKILFVILGLLIISFIFVFLCFKDKEVSSSIESNDNVYLKIDLQKQENDYYEYNYSIIGSNDNLYIKEKKWSSYCLQNVEDYINIKIENNNIFIELTAARAASLRAVISPTSEAPFIERSSLKIKPL